MTQRIQRTKAEIEKAKALDAAEKAALTTLADASANPRQHDVATRNLKKVKAQRKELAEQIAARNADKKSQIITTQSDAFLAQIKTEFAPLSVEGATATDWNRVIGKGDRESDSEPAIPPTPETPVSISEIEDRMARAKARLDSLGYEDHFKPARKYLSELCTSLREKAQQLRFKEQADQQEKRADREKREFLAGEAFVRPLREKFESRLAQGFLPLKLREEARLNFERLAADARHRMRVEIGNESQAIDNYEIRESAIWGARLEFFEMAAQRLAVFEWNLNNEPALRTLNAEFWGSGQAISASNLNFRTKTEKSLIVYVARKFFAWKKDAVGLAQLPNFPAPICIPESPVGLAELERMEQQRCLEALNPIQFDQINETIYSVPVATLENLHAPNLLLWPDGREVLVDFEVVYDHRAGGYRRKPEPRKIVEPNWSMGGQHFEWEQDESGEWQKVAVSNSPRDSWSQNAAGEWVKDSSLPNGDWQLQPLLKMVNGDRKPKDDRTEFRYGHWFTSQECEQAEKMPLHVNLLPSSEQRTVADQIGVRRDAETPVSPEEAANAWRRHEKEINSKKREDQQSV